MDLICKSFKNYIPYIGLSSLFIIFYLITFPGEMTSDSLIQLNAAQSGVYSNHHPAVMSFVWRHLLWLHDGGGGMYLLHGLMLFAASCLFIRTFQSTVGERWPLYYYALIAFFPPILQYVLFIWKDVGMTYAYLLAASILVYATMTKSKLQISGLILVTLLLFYGTAVKYQGQFILPVLCFWTAYACSISKTFMRIIGLGIAYFLVIFAAVKLVDHLLVPPAQDTHSWQKVKIYDLSGMSLDQEKPIYPDFILNNPHFDMKRIEQLFNRHRVDELSFINDTPTPDGKTEAEREELLRTWKHAVVTYPASYLKTRFLMWIHNFKERPFKTAHSLAKSERFNQYMPFIAQQPVLLNTIDFALDALKFIWYLPLVFLYIFLGAYYWRRTPAAPVLFFMNACGATLALILFVFSMAAIARYVYFTLVMLHFSHPFAWLVWKNRKTKL